MAILAECPSCRRKQAIKNKKCKCGMDLDKSKKNKKVRYWIDYVIPGGRARREPVGYSIEEAKDADGKRRVQKRENRIFEMLPESNMSFNDLADWYLKLATVKKLATYKNVTIVLGNFNKVFGDMIVGEIKPVHLEEYQEKRAAAGKKPATIDMEISIAKTMVNKAFENDKVAGYALKAFRVVKRRLKRGSNARKRVLGFDEYNRLLTTSCPHIRAMVEVGFNTGMRFGEIAGLRWKHVDLKGGFIRLSADSTKERKEKNVPINPRVEDILKEFGKVRLIDNDFVFIFRKKPIENSTGIKKGLAAACKKAGIPYGRNVENGFTFHDIRRTVKTNMMLAGIDKSIRDTILGHSLEGMDVHYIVPSENDLTMAMETYTAWMNEQMNKNNEKIEIMGTA